MMPARPRLFVRALPALAVPALFLLGGCIGYTVGTTLPPELKSIGVPTFINRTGEPQIETEVTRAVLQEFQREGQLKLADGDTGDIRLNGTVVSCQLEPMRYDRNRPTSVREYRVVVRAAIQAVNRLTGQPIVDTVVSGDATLSAVGDLVTAKRTALPEAARDLAHEIVNAVVSAW